MYYTTLSNIVRGFLCWPRQFRNIISRTLFLYLSLSLSLSLSFTFSHSCSFSLSLSLPLFLSLSLLETSKYQCTSDSESAWDYFFVWAKTYNGTFRGIFLEVKKVSAPSKDPSKWPFISFAREKNNLPLFQNQQYINSCKPFPKLSSTAYFF
jgi:hypothetical protein